MDIIEELRKAALDCEDGERDPVTGKSTWLKEETIEWAAADEIERLQLREETLSGIIDGMTARFIEAQRAVEEIERLRELRSLIALTATALKEGE